MSDEGIGRRSFVRLAGAAIAGGLAGCVVAPRPDSPSGQDGTSGAPGGTPTADDQTGPADGTYARLYEETIPSVLLVNTPGGTGHGSGFVYRDHILTNYHVVREATSVDVRFHGNEWRTARVVGRDAYADLAVMAVPDRPTAADSLEVRSTTPPIGTEVVVVGNPFEFDASLTRGVVSGVNRALPSPTGFTIPNTLQTDATIHPGNSGGPLLTTDGRVAGVVVGVRASGIGFAISAPLVRRIAPVLVDRGSYDHPYLGVVITPVTPRIAAANDLPGVRGVYVLEVDPNGPVAGRLNGTDEETTVDGSTVPVGGDVIVSIAGRAVDTTDQLSTAIAFETRPGETVEVGVVRDGESDTERVTMGTRPEVEPPSADENGDGDGDGEDDVRGGPSNVG